eukprot:g2045.t1
MDAYLLAAPSGFTSAVDTLNTASASSAANVVEQLKFATAGAKLSRDEVQSATNAVEYLCRGAGQHCASASDLGDALDSRTELDTGVIEAFARRHEASAREAAVQTSAMVAAAGGEGGAGAPWQGLGVGTFVSMEWKIGLAVRSSHCDELNAPYVSLLLKVADRAGHTTQHPLELSVAEFVEFRKVFANMGKVLRGM